jgi:CDP-diacylglycerol---serine O-phosphatidyltransferase
MTGWIKSLKMGIPSIITMLNLLAGCFAILLSFYDIALAGLMIFLAAILDFADGLAARVLNAYSDLGKELDSLADMVSFGVAPSFILFQLLQTSLILNNPHFSINNLSTSELLILSSSFMPAVFASLRLAKFNLATGNNDSFSGLPSPAAGIFFASAGYIVFSTDITWVREIMLNTGLLMAVNSGISLLMVIPLPMFSIKFRNLGLEGNETRYLFSLPSVFMLLYWGLESVPVIIIYYILLSAAKFLLTRTAKKPEL